MHQVWRAMQTSQTGHFPQRNRPGTACKAVSPLVWSHDLGLPSPSYLIQVGLVGLTQVTWVIRVVPWQQEPLRVPR